MQSLEPHRTYESEEHDHGAEGDSDDCANVHRAPGSERAGAGAGVIGGLDIGRDRRWTSRALETITSHLSRVQVHFMVHWHISYMHCTRRTRILVNFHDRLYIPIARGLRSLPLCSESGLPLAGASRRFKLYNHTGA